MQPGEIILLADADSLKGVVDPVFFAVLACPLCGAPGLITFRQYSGMAPVFCVSRACPCRFRIENQNRVVYLPVN